MRTGDKKFNRLPLFVAVLGCLYSASAFSQEQAQPAQEEDQEEVAAQPSQRSTDLERVTVTGSLLRRVEFDSVSPVQVITADTSVAVGMVDTAEFLQKSSVAAGSTQISHQFSGFVVEGGTGVQTVNLRGLGASRTAVLLNGNRPGPAGVRGQVLAFDLNVIPQSIVQRIEIVKDGSSSIYGSDALAGAVNIITRKNIDGPEFTVSGRVPFLGGGEVFNVSGATGWNFDNGNVMLAAEYYIHKPLLAGDRDFLRCGEDLYWNQAGQRIDREDRSIYAGTPYEGCTTVGIHNAVDDGITGLRYVRSWDGTTVGLLPGYRPNIVGSYTASNPQLGQAYHYQELTTPLWDDVQVIDRQERLNLFGSANFSLGNVNWDTEFLFNRRTTDTHRLRQFFPWVGGTTAQLASYRYDDGSDFQAPVPSGIARPLMPFHSDQSVEVDYGYLITGFNGLFGFTDTWAWSADLSYSRSKGTYSNLAILKSLSGDADPALRPWTGGRSPTFDYFQPCALNGDCIDDLVAAVGRWQTGNTTYDQMMFKGVVTGELFTLPAGPVGAAFGVEYRDFSIDDVPSEAEQSGDFWGQSSAVQTKGDDKVKEFVAEIEVPLLKGVPAFEALNLNVSGRWFDYDSVGDSDYVWRAGLSWQIIPQLRVRATKGTSYRAPGLYELYLGNLSGFASQSSVDPCLRWEESSNDFLRANCAAAGIPGDYNATGGSGASAEVFQGGGAGFLRPETSNAKTAGIIWTPNFAPISLAVDYFEYEVRDQISSLGAGTILQGCYLAESYPNQFCDMFIRNPNNHPTAPNKIEEVYATYVNINKQKIRGYDLLARYDGDYSFGKLTIEAQATYVKEDFSQTFSTAAASGFTTSDRLGTIGRPQLVGNITTMLTRNDFTYTWFMNFVDSTQPLNLSETFTAYQTAAPNCGTAAQCGWPNAIRDIKADSRLYHTASIRYSQPKWSLLVGVQNLFDAKPPSISNIGQTRYGNIPAFATQYDWYGRSLFARYNYKF